MSLLADYLHPSLVLPRDHGHHGGGGNSDSDSGLTMTQWVAIGIGIFVFVFTWLGVVIWLFFRYRERKRMFAAKDAERRDQPPSTPKNMSIDHSDTTSTRYFAPSDASVAGRRDSYASTARPMPIHQISTPTLMGSLTISQPIIPSAMPMGPQPAQVGMPTPLGVSIPAGMPAPPSEPPSAYLEHERLSQLPPVPRYSQATGIPSRLPAAGDISPQEQIPRYSPPQARSNYMRDENGFFIRADEKRPFTARTSEPPDGYYVP